MTQPVRLRAPARPHKILSQPAKPHADGLARLQGQSHIPASTWRRWCALLELSPQLAIELWEEVCWPLAIASGRQPELACLLQLRAIHPSLDIQTFKEDIAPFLHLRSFLKVLADPGLGSPKSLQVALLKYYKSAVADTFLRRPFTRFAEQFVHDVCRALTVTKVSRIPDITLDRVLRSLSVGRASLEHLVDLACSAFGDSDHAQRLQAFLRPHEQTQGPVSPGELIRQFRQLLQSLYEAEAGSTRGAQARPANLTRRRKAIEAFSPFRATIPGIEEARAMAQRREAACAPPPQRANGHSSSLSGPAIPSPGRTSASPQRTNSAGTAPAFTHTILPEAVPVSREIAAADPIAVITILPPRAADFDQAVRHIGQLLARVAVADQRIWSLFLEPGRELEDPGELARQLTADEGNAGQAYASLLQVSRYLAFKELIPNGRHILKEPPTSVQAQNFINHVRNSAHFSPEDRKVASLGRLLDLAAACLLRLEALKSTSAYFTESPQDCTRDTVISCFEKSLAQITARTDREQLEQVRSRADADIQRLLETLQARQFADDLVTACRAYTQNLRDSGHSETLEKVSAALHASPLELEQPVSTSPDEPLLELSLTGIVPSGLGKIFDAVASHVLLQAWKVLRPAHDPSQVLRRLERMLGEVLVDCLVLPCEKRRHQENPRIPLQVTSLDKLTRNASFRDFFVRVRDDGRIAFVNGFEDGRYVDLFELRTYTPSRVHTAAQKQKQEEGKEELQTGRQYLFSLGRTPHLFGSTPAEILASCVRGKSGAPVVFPVF